jgi:3-carboxy-cis,cis-muconate cycloisomerase
MVQEHERGVGGWQAEWPTVSEVIQSSGVAIASMAEVAEGLTVAAARMKENLKSTQGTIFAEKAALLLNSKLGREAAHKALEHATDPKRMRGRTLAQTLAEISEAQAGKKLLASLEDPEEYLGAAQTFTARLSSSTRRRQRGRK